MIGDPLHPNDSEDPMRIQVLELPNEALGEVVHTPFVIVIDEYTDAAAEDQAAVWQAFRVECGAKSILVTRDTVEIVR